MATTTIRIPTASRATLQRLADEQGRPTVTVTVNGAGYEVREGQTFADNLRLLEATDNLHERDAHSARQ